MMPLSSPTSPSLTRAGHLHAALTATFVLFAATLGCKFSVGGGTSGPSTGNGTTESGETGADPSGEATESPSAIEARKAAMERFQECSAQFDTLYATWKAQDEKTRKVISEAEGLPFLEGYPKLIAQAHENCETAKKLRDDPKASGVMVWARTKGSAINLAVAIAKLQVKHQITPTMALDRRLSEYMREAEFTGDLEFDKAEYCSKSTASFPWLPPKERQTQADRHNEHVFANEKSLNALADAINAIASKVGADRGRVKAVKKNADGSLDLTVKNLYGGSVCNHTGNYTWNGNFWSDCSYSGAVEKEIYPFTVKLAADKVPSPGIKTGDVISVWGIRTNGPNERDPKENASYDGLYVDSIFRANKMVWDVDISVSGELSCMR